jgi:sialate O-acetylesterase
MRFLLTLSLLSLPIWAQPVKITSGAAEYQVYQRGPGGKADITVSGTSTGKEVEGALIHQGKRVATFKTAVENGQWTGILKQAPAGGPYELSVGITGAKEHAVIGHLLVGDLWILAGQSNMEGVGNLDNLPSPHPLVNMLDMTDKWGVAKDPLHRLVDSVDRVHWRRVQGQPKKLEGADLDKYIAERKKGAGLGLPFALEMVKRTGVPIGLIPAPTAAPRWISGARRSKIRAAIHSTAACCAASNWPEPASPACSGIRANPMPAPRPPPNS